MHTRLLGKDAEYLPKSPYVLLHMQYFPLIYDHFLNAKNKLFSARMRHSPAFLKNRGGGKDRIPIMYSAMVTIARRRILIMGISPVCNPT